MMPAIPPDSHKISLKIIEAIKQHPVLYVTEVRGPPIKIQEFKQRVWKRISDELGLDPAWVRLKWKNLRDTYCRILKYKFKTEKGARRKKWIFEDTLSFLKFPYEPDYQPQQVELTEDYIRDINTGGISSEGLLEQLEDKEDEDYSEYLEVLEEATTDPIIVDSEVMEVFDNGNEQFTDNIESGSNQIQEENISEYKKIVQSKYKKIQLKRQKLDPLPIDVTNAYNVLQAKSENCNREDEDEILLNESVFINNTVNPVTLVKIKTNRERKQQPLSQMYIAPKDKTGIELFFDGIARTVERLPPKVQSDIKNNIWKLVSEAEVKCSAKASQNLKKFVASPGTMPKLVLIPCSMIDIQDGKN
ncbi:uncharacterized protein [Prorops nasuta]